MRSSEPYLMRVALKSSRYSILECVLNVSEMCLVSFDRLGVCSLMNTGMQAGYFASQREAGVS